MCFGLLFIASQSAVDFVPPPPAPTYAPGTSKVNSHEYNIPFVYKQLSDSCYYFHVLASLERENEPAGGVRCSGEGLDSGKYLAGGSTWQVGVPDRWKFLIGDLPDKGQVTSG